MKRFIIALLVGILMWWSSIGEAANIGVIGGYTRTPNNDFEAAVVLPYSTIVETTWKSFTFDFDWEAMYIHEIGGPGYILGTGPLFRSYVPVEENAQLYLLLGIGISNKWELPRDGMGTDFNFISSIGLGASIDINSIMKTYLEFRFSHLSNASMSDDNSGMNLIMFTTGVRFGDAFFKWLP